MLMALSLIAAACGSSDDTATADDPEAPSSADDASSDADQSDDDAMDDGDETDDQSDGDAMDDGDADAMDDADDDAMDDADGGYPVNVATSSGDVTIEAKPTSIVSLSPSATEMLFAIGAGGDVAAVDLFSNYPEEAPEGTLDGFTPDLEAIVAAGPDLVVASNLPEDITAGLDAAGVPVIFLPAASSFDDIYDQVAQLGEATGNIDGAASVNAEVRQGIEDVIEGLPAGDEPIRVFHEIDDSFYTATSNTFIGHVYSSMGFENVADPFDDGFGFPLVDGESIIAADPTLIVFTDQALYSAEDIAARPGWDTVTAVANGNIVEVEADIASRWGPRVVEFMEAVAAAVTVDA